jgi:hypothetical protein
MNYDRVPSSPRLILDDNIDFGSLGILLRYGLDQRCSGVYQSWCAKKKRDDELLEQRESDTIAAGQREEEAALVRVKDGIVKWLAGEATARYPCVQGPCSRVILKRSAQVFDRRIDRPQYIQRIPIMWNVARRPQ